jgi:hypothetical protein
LFIFATALGMRSFSLSSNQVYQSRKSSFESGCKGCRTLMGLSFQVEQKLINAFMELNFRQMLVVSV